MRCSEAEAQVPPCGFPAAGRLSGHWTWSGGGAAGYRVGTPQESDGVLSGFLVKVGKRQFF